MKTVEIRSTFWVRRHLCIVVALDADYAREDLLETYKQVEATINGKTEVLDVIGVDSFATPVQRKGWLIGLMLKCPFDIPT